MIFHPTKLHGAFLVEPERRGDPRGFFARMFCQEEFAAAGLEPRIAQANESRSAIRGTLRGLHYQLPPAAETKLVRVIAGAVFDVLVDLRPDSPTYLAWFGAELNTENRLAMYVPRGVAHSLLTLTAQTELVYLISAAYAPQHERGLRWNDPAFAIEWPIPPQEISAKDAAWPDFEPGFHGVEQLRGLI